MFILIVIFIMGIILKFYGLRMIICVHKFTIPHPNNFKNKHSEIRLNFKTFKEAVNYEDLTYIFDSRKPIICYIKTSLQHYY